jgi:hypothetical protein
VWGTAGPVRVRETWQTPRGRASIRSREQRTGPPRAKPGSARNSAFGVREFESEAGCAHGALVVGVSGARLDARASASARAGTPAPTPPPRCTPPQPTRDGSAANLHQNGVVVASSAAGAPAGAVAPPGGQSRDDAVAPVATSALPRLCR